MRLASADVATPFVPDVLARDGFAWVRESSDSMAPLIRPGDRLRLAPIDRSSLQQGDVVAYRRGPHLIVHRVIVRQRDGVITKGDALPHRDTALPWDALVGRVVALVDVGGRVHDLSSGPWSAVTRLVAPLSRLGEACAAPPDRWWRRAGWATLRLPVHLCAWVLR
jgi:signal peptidase I